MKQTHGEVKQVNPEDREIEFIASREVPDRDSEVILVRGIDTRPFMQNPTLLLQHDTSTRFGRVTSLRVEEVDGALALIGKAKILPEGISAEADAAYAELRFGSLNGISIGFMPKETSREKVHPAQEGRTIVKSELLEISVVTIPACSSCVVTEKSPSRMITVRDGQLVLGTNDDRAVGLTARLSKDLPEALTPSTVVDARTAKLALTRLLPELCRSLSGTIREEVTQALDYHTGRVR